MELKEPLSFPFRSLAARGCAKQRNEKVKRCEYVSEREERACVFESVFESV